MLVTIITLALGYAALFAIGHDLAIRLTSLWDRVKVDRAKRLELQVSLATMTVKQMKQLARERHIKLPRAANKAKLFEVIGSSL